MQDMYVVTGGAGYIGSHVVVALAQQNRVLIIDNFCNAERNVISRIKSLCPSGSIDLAAIDISDATSLRTELVRAQQFHRVRAVVHCAGLKAVGDGERAPLEYWRANVGATLVLCEVMQEIGLRNLVFSSSATVYGAQQAPLEESMPRQPSNTYGATKAAIEQLLENLCNPSAEQPWRVISLRYFNPVGAHPSHAIGEAPRAPNNLMPCIVRAVQRGEPLPIFGTDYATADGSAVRDYVHVMDLADAHVAACDALENGADRANGHGGHYRVYNIGRGVGISVLEMIDAFERCTGQRVLRKVETRRAGDVAACWCDCARATQELGWAARRTLEDMCVSAWIYAHTRARRNRKH